MSAVPPKFASVVVVGVTGSIAAYKSADLVSRLVKEGCEVHVVMTPAAQQFITPLTLQTLSRTPVITSVFDGKAGSRCMSILGATVRNPRAAFTA